MKPILVIVMLAAGSALAGWSVQAAAAMSPAADANLRLGVAYLQQGNLSTAKDKLERAQSLAPNNVEILTALALLYGRLGDPDKAESQFKAALRLAPKDPELANNYGVYLCDHGRQEEGVKRFEQAGTDPLYAAPWRAYTNAGVCLRAAKQDGAAERAFQRALQLRPQYSEAIYQMAVLELAQKKAPAAATRIDAYVRSNGGRPDMLLLGWLSMCEAKDKIGAVKMARRLQELWPDAAETKAALKGCGNG
jgi:type IV pilus assembly protein PilF